MEAVSYFFTHQDVSDHLPFIRITSIFFSNVMDIRDLLGTFLYSLGFTALLLPDMADLSLVV
jgi:hypothetical protein